MPETIQVHDLTKRKEITMKPTEREVHAALRTIVVNKDAKALNYAVNYARAGTYMFGEELRIQCLYVLGNMVHWRGDDAKKVRETLKRYTK
jgi:hypothetical protein